MVFSMLNVEIINTENLYSHFIFCEFNKVIGDSAKPVENSSLRRILLFLFSHSLVVVRPDCCDRTDDDL